MAAAAAASLAVGFERRDSALRVSCAPKAGNSRQCGEVLAGLTHRATLAHLTVPELAGFAQLCQAASVAVRVSLPPLAQRLESLRLSPTSVRCTERHSVDWVAVRARAAAVLRSVRRAKHFGGAWHQEQGYWQLQPALFFDPSDRDAAVAAAAAAVAAPLAAFKSVSRVNWFECFATLRIEEPGCWGIFFRTHSLIETGYAIVAKMRLRDRVAAAARSLVVNAVRTPGGPQGAGYDDDYAERRSEDGYVEPPEDADCVDLLVAVVDARHAGPGPAEIHTARPLADEIEVTIGLAHTNGRHHADNLHGAFLLPVLLPAEPPGEAEVAASANLATAETRATLNPVETHLCSVDYDRQKWLWPPPPAAAGAKSARMQAGA